MVNVPGLKTSQDLSIYIPVVCSEKSVFKSLSGRVMRTIKIGGGLKDWSGGGRGEVEGELELSLSSRIFSFRFNCSAPDEISTDTILTIFSSLLLLGKSESDVWLHFHFFTASVALSRYRWTWKRGNSVFIPNNCHKHHGACGENNMQCVEKLEIGNMKKFLQVTDFHVEK